MPVLRRAFSLAARVFGRPADPKSQVIVLPPTHAPSRGTVALSYLIDCFDGEHATHYHTNRWECHAIARALTDAGFRVEAVDFNNHLYRPPVDCVLVFDIHSNLERFAPMVSAGTKKLLHATGAHWLFQNRAELARLEALRLRRGATLPPRRQVPPSRGIEVADLATTTGNRFTIETFAFARKPIHRIPLSSTYTQDWPGEKNFSALRTRFLWFGSHGLVHKGLDLVLEAFVQTPELQLTIAGPVSSEPDFMETYRRELALPNVRLLDWVDTGSPAFRTLLAEHGAIVYPSCSEGGGGSAITCMHGGLIPIVTREASVDTEDFGVELREASVAAIVESVRRVAAFSPTEFATRSRATWEFARRQHTRENFDRTFRSFISEVLQVPAPRQANLPA